MENKKDYIENISTDAERRAITGKVETRKVEGQAPEIVGTAAVFNTPTDMGWYDEEIAEGAFEGCDMSDVVALNNHDDDDILSRTTGKSDDLTLSIDATGLHYNFIAKNECANECAANIDLGFIRGSSFAFITLQSVWTENTQPDGSIREKRTITKIKKLIDVSPVTFPAYPSTSVALRSKQAQSKPVKTILDLRIKANKKSK